MSFNIESAIGITAGIFTAFSLVPQLIKMLKEKKYDSISPVMLSVLMIGLALWIVYGVFKSDIPIIATNAFSFLVNLIILTLRLVHGKSSESMYRQ